MWPLNNQIILMLESGDGSVSRVEENSSIEHGRQHHLTKPQSITLRFDERKRSGMFLSSCCKHKIERT